METIETSIIVPVKNGQKYLDSALKAIFSQETDAKFEVIAVDSGSTDNTLDILKNYPVQLYQIRDSEFNHGATRNYAISKSRGRYVILMNSDTVPFDKHWLEMLVNNLKKDKDAAGAYSRQIPHNDSSLLTWLRVGRFITFGKIRRESQITEVGDYEKLKPKDKYILSNFDNVSSCIRKDIWQKIPFPDTDFAEDLEWSRAVLRAGYKIIYDPRSVVYHSHEFSFMGWYRKNCINSNRISGLFGFSPINKLYKVFMFSSFYIIRDIYSIFVYKRNFKAVLTNLWPVIAYSFVGALGQYRGARDTYVK